jgi:tRNA threonylcarbamoyladenosine biosynthesis protein TsaE
MVLRRLLLRSAEAEQMQQWAAQWVHTLPAGTVLALRGPLGAGKTTFTSGLVRGLLPQARVSSPTFCYLHIYEGSERRVAHFDCYRLRDPDEFALMGWDEVWDQAHLTVIEWPERLGSHLPERALILDFEHAGTDREIWQSSHSTPH